MIGIWPLSGWQVPRQALVVHIHYAQLNRPGATHWMELQRDCRRVMAACTECSQTACESQPQPTIIDLASSASAILCSL